MKIMNHPHIKVYALYCFSFILVGMLITALGPLLPFFAAREDHSETFYSFLFLSRALGFIAGSLLIKILEKWLNLHQLATLSLLMNFFAIPFSFASTPFGKGLFIFLFSVGNAWTDIVINVAIIKMFQGEDMQSWLQTCHGAFAVGGLLGPYFVYLFELKSFAVLGVSGMAMACFYPFFTSPEKVEKSLKEPLAEQSKQPKQMSLHQVLLICFMFWLIMGQFCSYGGWVSSYAVMNDYASKEHATLYGSVYWMAVTCFRFIFAFVEGPASTKLLFLFALAAVTPLLSLLVVLTGYSEQGLLLGSLLLGTANSVVFPLTFMLPYELGHQITTQNSANFMLAASIGEGTLAVFVGSLIDGVSSNFLFYSTAFFNLVLFYCVKLLLKRTSVNQEVQTVELQDLSQK